MKNPLYEFHVNNIRNTEKEAIVSDVRLFVCNLTFAVTDVINDGTRKVYINTRALKHLYDKKPAEEYNSILTNLYQISRYPDNIYKNKNSKRGDLVFTKEIRNVVYLASLELIKTEEQNELEIVTAFRLRKESYLEKYEHYWSWKDGYPSS